MAKEVMTIIKLQVPAGGANPSPPVGPALGQHGLNIMDFCNAFNEKTKELEKGIKVPVEITVFEDRSFTFITKSPPAAVLLKKAAGIDKASGEPNRNKVAKISVDKVKEIAEMKMEDLNLYHLHCYTLKIENPKIEVQLKNIGWHLYYLTILEMTMGRFRKAHLFPNSCY